MVPTTSIYFHLAQPHDRETILAMMRDFYALDDIRFDEPAARRALQQLLEDANCGSVWLIQAGEKIAGYVVLCLGFSLEYHGRDAFVDELYVHEDFRGQGLGKRALSFVEATSRDLGVRALHLEVERTNLNAQTLYRKQGFVDHDHYLMTKWLEQL